MLLVIRQNADPDGMVTTSLVTIVLVAAGRLNMTPQDIELLKAIATFIAAIASTITAGLAIAGRVSKKARVFVEIVDTARQYYTVTVSLRNDATCAVRAVVIMAWDELNKHYV